MRTKRSSNDKGLGSIKKKNNGTLYSNISFWLNQIEIWFNSMTKDVLKGGVWKSRKQLVDH